MAPLSPLKPSKLNTGGEGNNWDYATNDSFDSVLDLPADGTQSAQRRKRQRRREAPTASTSLSIPGVPNTPAIVQPESHPPQGQTPPSSKKIAAYAPVGAQTSGSRFGPLTRSWIQRLMTSIPRRAHKPSFTNVNEPLRAQQSQANAEENPSESRQVGDSRSRERRQRNVRRNDEIGMIAPAPMYDRYGVATEEYWYDPNNPPLIDRIFFCMICCGVPKDNASYKTDADAEPSVPAADAQAGPSHSQNHPVPSAANANTFASANPSTSTPHLGKVRRLWRRISNLVLRPLHRKKQESHQLQNLSHTVPQHSGQVLPP